jgi:hypothetical protein
MSASNFYTPGWHNDPAEVEATLSRLPMPFFGDSPANLVTDIPDHVFLWEAYRAIHGKNPPSKNQKQVGSCVSFGTNTGVERTMAVEIAIGGEAEEFKHIAEEVTYGGSRVEVGGGRLNGDGSVGSWAAEFVLKWGVVARVVHGGVDLSTYSESRCREYGSKGVPAELETLAREHPVGETALVKSWPEAKAAMASGYGLAVCSDQGFSMQRDANGICRPSGSWAHCMCIDGYVTINGKEYGHIENSWGEQAHTGPVGPGDPPPSGFWAPAETIERMIRQGDTWAFSKLKGFPARTISWYV